MLTPFAEELVLDVESAVKSGDPANITRMEHILTSYADEREIDFADRNELMQKMSALLAEEQNKDTKQPQGESEQHVA